jgi:lysophospholipase L1-like esterase
MTLYKRAIIVLAVTSFAGCSGSPIAPTPPPPPIAAPDPPTALTISCPADVTTTTKENTTVAVPFAQATASGGVAPVQVSCTREPDSMFASGTTTVQCTARDAAGQTSSCVFDVTVIVEPPRLTRTKFLAFGDSLTIGEVTVPVSGTTSAGYPNFVLSVATEAAYPTKLQTLLRSRYSAQSSSIEVVNEGKPGEWAQDGQWRLPGLLASTRVEVVIILEGYNDIGTYRDSDIRAAANAVDRMAKEARNRGARVVLGTLPPPRPGGTKSVPTQIVTNYNDRIRTIAAGERALLVDLYADMITDVARYIGVDGLHPTEAGYERMAELFLAAIRADMEAR